MTNPYLEGGPNPFLAPDDGDSAPSGNIFSRTIAGVRQAAAQRGGYAPLAADLLKTWFRQTKTALTAAMGGMGGPADALFMQQYGPDFRNNPQWRADLASGTANIATFGVGSMAAGVPTRVATKIGGGALTRAAVKGATYFGLEALGGATYGAIAPTPPGESKLQSIGENAALFAATSSAGALMSGAARQARALPGLIRGLQPAAEDAAAVAGRAPDALRSLTDEQLAAQPLGATPPLEQSAAAPGAQEAQIARLFEERRVAEHPVDVERRRAGLPTDNMNVAVREVAAEIHPLAVSDASVQQGMQTVAMPERGLASPMQDLSFPEPPAGGGSPTLPRNRTLQRWTAELQRLSTEQLRGLATLEPGALGAPAKQVGVRLGATGIGLGALGLSEDDNLSPADRAFLRLVGGAFVVGGTSRFLGAKFAATGWGSQVLNAMNPLGQIFDPTLKRAATGSLGFYNMGAATRQVVQEALERVVPKGAAPADLLNFSEAIELGERSPAWGTLTPAQQETFSSLHDLHDWMGEFGQHVGFWRQYREDYFSKVFPKERLQRSSGLSASATPSAEGFLKPSADWTLRQATDWANKNGIAPPIADPRLVVPAHMESFFRTLTQHQAIDHFTRLGALKPSDLEPGLAANTQIARYTDLGWRRVENVPTLPNHLAPSPVAALLEHINGRSAPGVLARAYDAAQNTMMRVIMWNAAIHGVNVLRGAASLDGGVSAYSQYWNMVSQADPVMLEAARSGAAIFGRSDVGPKLSQAMDAALASARGDAPATVGKLRQLVGPVADWNDHVLWNRAVPALGLHAWGQYMHDWAESTGGKFTVGTPQYEGAARQAAEFANRQMGLTEPLVRSPQFAATLRRMFFAPNWMMSRISLMTHTYGQVADVMAGQVNPLHAAYLQQRIRMLAVGGALTYAGSLAMSGKPPEFNESTLKFYMRTGQINPQTGRELGIDLLGWWQDDTRAFNNPLGFMVSKLNPVLANVQDVVSGRDFFGRQLSTPEQIVNVFNATPLGAAGSAISAAASGNRADLLRYGSRTVGVGGAASLPRPVDATIGAFAQRLLTEQNIPVTDDRTREVALLLRGNLLRGRPLISNEIIHLLANEKRQVSAPAALWMKARGVLAHWAATALGHGGAPTPAPTPAAPSSSNPFLAPQ